MERGRAVDVLLIAAAYLIGAVPFGLLIGLARGIDVRRHGSRNIGATNVGRVLGRKWGFLCLALDILKGLGPMLIAGQWLAHEPRDAWFFARWLMVALAAVLGHVFPIYLGFRGGKGVATTVGVALGLFPHYTVAMTAALGAYAVARYTTRMVSAGSLALAVVFPLALAGYSLWRGDVWVSHWPLHAVAVALSALLIVRHRANITRILRGEELRISTLK